VTGVEVIIRNIFLKVRKILPEVEGCQLLFVLLYPNAIFVYFTVPSNKANKQHGRLLIMYDVRFSHNICTHGTTTYSLATV